jgi:hypothetical protein
MREATANEERRVREYVNAESPEGDQVTFIQRLGTRKIVGRSHTMFDVRTKRSRWWVISDPMMNLYPQSDFQDIQMALTYHIGLCAVVAEKSRKTFRKPKDELLTGAWRRFERAIDAFNDADEAEAFQGVGVICREALLELIRAEAKRAEAAADVQPPKLADFKSWSRLLLASIAQARLRAYLTSLADKTWDLTVWLQHYRDAAPWDAEAVIAATGHFISIYAEQKLVREAAEGEERCPRCGSYRLEDASRMADDEKGWLAITACAACGWESDTELQRWPTGRGASAGYTDLDAG